MRLLVAEYCPQIMVSVCAASAEEARQLLRQDAVDLIFLKAYSSYQRNFAELTDGTRLSIPRHKLAELLSTMNK